MGGNDSKVISVRVPIPLYEKLHKEVEVDSHLSIGEYTRSALREKLEDR